MKTEVSRKAERCAELNRKLTGIVDALSRNALARDRAAARIIRLGQQRSRLEIDRHDLCSELRELQTE